MILLGTNVISELWKPAPAPQVLQWLDTQADGLIAAIATAHDLSVATRDASPFEAAGVAVINPWGD